MSNTTHAPHEDTHSESGIGVQPVAWRVRRSDGQYELYFHHPTAVRAAECYVPHSRAEPLYSEYVVSEQEKQMKTLIRELEANQVYVRELCRAVDAATDFAGTVAAGASWWDDVWPEHFSALDRAREDLSLIYPTKTEKAP